MFIAVRYQSMAPLIFKLSFSLFYFIYILAQNGSRIIAFSVYMLYNRVNKNVTIKDLVSREM